MQPAEPMPPSWLAHVQPDDLVASLAGVLPQIVDELTARLRDEFPDYAVFLAADRQGSLDAAEVALHRLLATVTGQRRPGASPADDEVLRAFEEVGRIEWREGRELASLLAAYRLGARTAWRHVSRAAIEGGLTPDALAGLAEAVFLVVDELSSASADGYLAEQRESSAERQRRRDELAELLLNPAADEGQVRRAAAAAGWTVPARACLVLSTDPTAGDRMSVRLGSSALPVRTGGATGVVLPDPRLERRRDELAGLLAGCGAVVGSAVPPAELPTSLERVRLALDLARQGLVRGDPVFVDENLAQVLLHRDPELLALLVDRALEPLRALPATTRRKLEPTLRAWLATMGDSVRVAELLGVHPHTVHYRMGQLREQLGDALDDPRQRLQLTLALAATGGARDADEPKPPRRRRSAPRPR